MAVITYPLLTVVDDHGAIVTGASVTITSVTDKSGSTITSPGATLFQAGANVSVDYDAETKGEAWVTLDISKSGSDINGVNKTPSFFIAKDSSRIMTALPNAAIPAAVLDAQFEGSWTLAEFCRLAAAVLLGNSTGGGIHFTSPVDGSTLRISATVDGSSNRTVSPPVRS